ncbi:unnamed protein product [Hymenolepis diminuta]|uniref:MIT domain-containing protein n=1 Tax=Hymenolepis diminuta TaxID=6216 RepID=A0A0R3SUT4_HYMDI|nr:unnamed protein product [Hymenolepis diminuta]VUZ56837.1 unnamed protein product [Hymenolepis diminuta]
MTAPCGQRNYQYTINFYERKTDEALYRAAKYRDLLERSYANAIESLEHAIEYLEKEKSLCGDDCGNHDLLDVRERSLRNRLQIMQPYRRYMDPHSPNKPVSENYNSKLSNMADTFVILDHQPLYPLSNPSPALKMCPKNKDERLEELQIRIVELEKMVDQLSRKLEQSERRARAEEDARFIAEGQLLMMSSRNPANSDSSYSGLDTSITSSRSFRPGRFTSSFDEDQVN